MASGRQDRRDLLGTSNTLLAKWSVKADSQLAGSKLTSSLAAVNSTPAFQGASLKMDSTSRLAEDKQRKTYTSTSLLSTSSSLALTSSLSKGLITPGSLLSSLSTLGLKLESPLSNLRLRSEITSTCRTGFTSASACLTVGVKPSETTVAGPKYKSSLQHHTLLPQRSAPTTLKTTKPVYSEHKDVARSKLGISKSKKLKLDRKATSQADQEKCLASLPHYSFRTDEADNAPMEIDSFIPPDKDVELIEVVMSPLQDVTGLKNGLVNAVSASLLCSPNFSNPSDPARTQLIDMTHRVLVYDAEFVLKVALYCRRGLNIRTTTNFLLALAANRSECRPYLRKYYCSCIMLPSDWIEVAEIYQAFRDKSLNFGSLPAALRKVMIAKFPDFDKYQLAKYNKDKSKSKKKKEKRKSKKELEKGADNATEAGRGRGAWGSPRGARGSPRGGRGSLMRPGQKRHIELDSESSEDSDRDGEEENVKRQVSGVEYDEESETEEQRELKTFTLKQLIRKLHITEPVEHVMSLIGKKYPMTAEEFYKSRLPGVWEEQRADKRMKLPVPETWETQVSLRGNKPEVWQDLIDNRKLPFMAMLRNLRNLIKAGISDKHHNSIIRRLTNQKQVVNSKQFPFRFFSAYDVLQTLEKDYHEAQKLLVEEAISTSAIPVAGGRGRGQGRGRGRGRGQVQGHDQGSDHGSVKGKKTKGKEWWMKRQEKQKQQKNATKETPYDEKLIQRYRKALDTAVKIATVHNVMPIRGRTIIFCNLRTDAMVPCQAARKGLGKPRSVAEVSVLLALMCKYSCEESELVVYNDQCCHLVELEKGTVLDNMERVLKLASDYSTKDKQASSWDDKKKKVLVRGFPYWILGEKMRDQVQVDNLIILDFDLSPTQSRGAMIGDFLRPYRRLVNPSLMYVSICTATAGCKFSSEIVPEHENDIYISGFSDAILRFIAERGSGGQLQLVDNIDKAFDLLTPTPLALETVDKSVPVLTPEKPLAVPRLVPRWRTARVFISSTFRDMHGERDLLTRYVFPELRAVARQHFINVFEVDLRWGVTEEISSSNKTLQTCLLELTKCQLFMGILGSRYGWVPTEADVPNTPEFDCVRQYPKGASVTELEMHFGALNESQKNNGKAFFFIRDDNFEKDIPAAYRSDFIAESEESKVRLTRLKDRVRSSGLEVFDRYPCQWGGIVDHKPIVAGLEEFGQRALNNLWAAVRQLFPDDDAMIDEDTHIMRLHRAFVDSHREQFVGRKALIKQCINQLVGISSGLLGLIGKPGSGKSSLMASLIHGYVESRHCISGSHALVHIVGAAPGSCSLAATLRRLSIELKHSFSLTINVPDDYRSLIVAFGGLLQEAGKVCGSASPLVLFVDGIYLMDSTHQPCNLQWLPDPLPPNVVVVLSAVEGDITHAALTRRKAAAVVVGSLDMFDKAEVVRQTLAAHRKALDETPFNNQLKFLMMKKEAHNPLFLKMACEELRVFGVFEKVTSKLKAMSHTTHQLLQEVLQRLETDHGTEVIATTMSLLICARDGLLPEELQKLLAWHSTLKGQSKIQPEMVLCQPFPVLSALPPVIFAFLLRSVQSFLNPLNSNLGNVRLTLAHQDIATAVRQRYLRGSSAVDEIKLHCLLAGFFFRQADPDGDRTWRGRNPRAFSELPYHLFSGGCFKDLSDALCNLHFIHTKCQLGMASQLMDDYVMKGCLNKALDKEQAKYLSTPRVQEFRDFLSRNLHILSRNPSLIWQQASNSLEDSVVCSTVKQLRNSGLLSNRGLMDWNNKPSSPDPCYLQLENLSQPVTCIAVSPDNKYFATGGQDCLVRLFDMSTGRELRFYRGHFDTISDVCFVGKSILCSASLDATVSLWDVELGHRHALLKGHSRRVNACAADRSAKLVASASWDCRVCLWNATSGENICDFNLECPVNDVKFHPEGQLIVTASWDSTIRIFDILHRVRKAVLRGHASSVRSVAFSNDGCHIASAAMDGDVKIWSATKGIQVGSITGHGGPINKLTFSPTGRELITASDDCKVKVWSGELGMPLQVVGHESNGAATAVTLSKDGSAAAVGYHTGFVRVFDVETGVQLWESKVHTMPVRAVTYSPDNNYILSGSDDTKVMLLEASQGTKISMLEGHSKPVLCVRLTKDHIATTSEDCTCCLYPPVKTCKANKSVKPRVVLKGHTGPVTGCSFAPGGQKLATSSRDMSVCIWDLNNTLFDAPPPEVTMAQCHSDWVNACQWSPTSNFMVTASNDFNLKVWDMKTREERYRLQGHTSSVNTLAYKYGCVVSGSTDGQVKVWSHRGTEITTLFGHTLRVNAVDVFVKCQTADRNRLDEVTDDAAELPAKSWAEEMEEEERKQKEEAGNETADKGRKGLNVQDVIVASVSDDGTVRFWRPLQANTLACLTGHSDRVLAVAADQEGEVATAGLDHSVRLWKPTLQPTQGEGHEVEVTCLAAGPDGTCVLSADRLGMVHLWQQNKAWMCTQRVKAHDKAVMACCFSNMSSTCFVTASDDMTLAEWEILTRKDGTAVRKRNSVPLLAPVTGLIWHPSLTSRQSESAGFVVGSSWDGHVFSWVTSNSSVTLVQAVVSRQKEEFPYSHWPLSLYAADNKILLTTSLGQVHVYSATLKSPDELELSSVLQETVPTDSAVSPSKANWPLCAALSQGRDNSIYIGDSLGQLSCLAQNEWKQMKIHNQGITGLLVIKEVIFTVSSDSTIKVWRNRNNGYSQLGQFYCQAPVTSICELESKSSEVQLMAGDQLGNIYTLTWNL